MDSTQVYKDLSIAEAKEKYDENVKRILSEKIILAHILAYAVPEFKGMNPKDIVSLIEGEIEVGKVAVQPGETNKPKITGSNTESCIPNEGKVTYDIRFFVLTPDRKNSIKLIIDLEAQNKFYPGYDLVTRGIFYVGRLISSQLGTEFKGDNYNDIKKVYSIWICTEVPKYAENTLTEYSMVQKNIVGNYPKGKNRYDLMSVIMIGLSEKIAKEKDEWKLHRLLETLLSSKISIETKKQVLEKEYDIKVSKKLDRRQKVMCNLSEGIEERGIKKGEELVNILNAKLLEAGRTEDMIRSVRDKEYQNILFEELGLRKNKAKA